MGGKEEEEYRLSSGRRVWTVLVGYRIKNGGVISYTSDDR